jgi:tetratricopeptide (TPR) repeat protein
MNRTNPWIVVIVLLLSGSFVSAQQDAHVGCAVAPSYVPAELLERSVKLQSGIGNSQEAVTTQSSEAQAYYNQGLNYLESYVWIEAARSFYQALRHDRNLAMAYIGLSRVYSGLDNPTGAKMFFEKAKALAAKVSDPERRRIEIREKQLEAMQNLEDAAKHQAYKNAIDTALTTDLNDPQLWLLRGNAEEANASGRGQRGTASSVAFYEQVLRIMPDHASAHHFLVHTYENIGRIDKALEHGEAYARLAPSIPHAVHMWAHDLRRVGRTDEAIDQFKRADQLERAYYEKEKIDPELDWHHGHNLDLLAACYQHKGQMKFAEKTMREAWNLSAMEAYRAFSLRELPNFLIHRARYEEALTTSRDLAKSKFVQARAAGHALAGQVLIGLGRIDEAGKALEAAQRELEQVPRVTSGINPNRAIVEPWVQALRGELLVRTGNTKEGKEILRTLLRILRTAPGADAWAQGLFRLETIARTARETGNWDLAEATTQELIAHDAAYAGSHLALALVREHHGDTEGMARAFNSVQKYWRDADTDLPELKFIREKLAAIQVRN